MRQLYYRALLWLGVYRLGMKKDGCRLVQFRPNPAQRRLLSWENDPECWDTSETAIRGIRK